MRRHFEKRELITPTTDSHGDSPQHRSRRKSWSGVLGWHNKFNKHNTNTDMDSNRRSHSNKDNNTIGNTSSQPQQQQQQHNVLTATNTVTSTSTDNSIDPLSPPSTIYSVATTIQGQDHYSPQHIHLSAFHTPLSSPSPYNLDDDHHEHQPKKEKGKQDINKNRKTKPVIAMTVLLRNTYLKRNPTFRYDSTKNPRRVLTKPSLGCKNSNYDNENSDLILYVNCVLGDTCSDNGNAYVVREMLGSGTFGQVVKCLDISTGQMVGVKVIKNKPAYLKQSMIEVDILKHLNNEWDPDGQHHILRLFDVFTYRHHLCLVFELLSVNLYELIKQNKFRGLSINLVRVLSAQIVDVLIILKEAGIIHCDLKPENILLKNLESPGIKVIDFGSACHRSNRLYTYIQSRFYRSPEVLLGIKYTNAIDMWSFGCIVAELFLGLPIFPGSSEYNQLSRIIDSLGSPPIYMTEQGRNSKRFFNRIEKDGKIKYTLKSRHQYMDDENKNEKVGKKYFATTNIEELILSYPMPRKHMSEKDKSKEMKKRKCLVDFLKQVLQIDPMRRMTPHEAKYHPFITGDYATFATNQKEHGNSKRDTTTTTTTTTLTAATTTTASIVSDSNDTSTPRKSISKSHDVSLLENQQEQKQPQEQLKSTELIKQEDMSNWCICGIDKGHQISPQHKADQFQDQEIINKNKKAVINEMGTPPLSPVESNVKEASIAGISTATNIPQSNRGSRRSSLVGLTMTNEENNGMRYRQPSVQ
ncbi:kinase-like domain-containing protein [Circinella umbellata]|nr:kinase-like domain-containing protein [Circinella umbellata]